jgi:hypothetical protein
MTPSRRALLAVLQRTTETFVAARCAVHKGRVSRWASGEGKPGPEARRRLHEIYGIPEDAWTPDARVGVGR